MVGVPSVTYPKPKVKNTYLYEISTKVIIIFYTIRMMRKVDSWKFFSSKTTIMQINFFETGFQVPKAHLKSSLVQLGNPILLQTITTTILASAPSPTNPRTFLQFHHSLLKLLILILYIAHQTVSVNGADKMNLPNSTQICKI